MPILTIEGPKLSAEKKREFAARATQVFHEVFGHPKEIITMVFHENEPENIASGGKLLTDIFASQKPPTGKPD